MDRHSSKITCVAALTAGALLLCVCPRASGQSLVHGVAAGDVRESSAILWARSIAEGPLIFEYSTNRELRSNVRVVDSDVTDPQLPVKIFVRDLAPNVEYHYRVTDVAGDSARGKFRTPGPENSPRGLRFGLAADWDASHAPYPVLKNAAGRDLDFFIELGDTVYVGEARTVQQYRSAHSTNYTERFGLNHWADLRSSTAIMAIIDDHDVADDFSGGAHPLSDLRFESSGRFINETERYRNALQVFHEFNPIRSEIYGADGEDRTDGKTKLYRTVRYGTDAALFLVDTRSFRDEKLPNVEPSRSVDILLFLTQSYDANRTMLGQQQLAELKGDLLSAESDGVVWKFISSPLPIQNFGVRTADKWDGYAAERDDLLRFIDVHEIRNVVFLTADRHMYSVNGLNYGNPLAGEPQVRTPCFEVMVPPLGRVPSGPFFAKRETDRGVIDVDQRRHYNQLASVAKDAFIQWLLEIEMTAAPLSYDPIGLGPTDGVQARLVEGSYFVAHKLGWTEVDIAPETRRLTVTTYGIDDYTEEDLEQDLAAVLERTPEVVAQFHVDPVPAHGGRPQAVFQATPESGVGPLVVQVDASSSTAAPGASIFTYDWDFGDGTLAKGLAVSHTYDTPGRYTLALKVTDDRGLTATAVHNINVFFPVEPVPAWTSTDIGEVDFAGGSRFDGSDLVLFSGGRNITGTEDRAHFVYQEVEGDVAIATRIASMAPEGSFSKVGLMFRPATDGDSPHVSVVVQSGPERSVLKFIYRPSMRGEAEIRRVNLPGSFEGPWLRLERRGDLFTALASTDGETWFGVGAVRLELPVSLLGGAVATAYVLGDPLPTSTARLTGLALGAPAPFFLRADCNGDGGVLGEVSDAVFLLNFLFASGATPSCLAACDVNGDGEILGVVSDVIYLLSASFGGGPHPPAPFPDCGFGTANDRALGCDVLPVACQ